MTNVYELANMQGLPRSILDKMLATSQTLANVGGAIGDAMSINVLMRIFVPVLKSAGLDRGTKSLGDVWRHCHSIVGRMPDALYVKKGCTNMLLDV
jgi:hypothetical protein